jgi:hypothetical protein
MDVRTFVGEARELGASGADGHLLHLYLEGDAALRVRVLAALRARRADLYRSGTTITYSARGVSERRLYRDDGAVTYEMLTAPCVTLHARPRDRKRPCAIYSRDVAARRGPDRTETRSPGNHGFALPITWRVTAPWRSTTIPSITVTEASTAVPRDCSMGGRHLRHRPRAEGSVCILPLQDQDQGRTRGWRRVVSVDFSSGRTPEMMAEAISSARWASLRSGATPAWVARLRGSAS